MPPETILKDSIISEAHKFTSKARTMLQSTAIIIQDRYRHKNLCGQDNVTVKS